MNGSPERRDDYRAEHPPDFIIVPDISKRERQLLL